MVLVVRHAVSQPLFLDLPALVGGDLQVEQGAYHHL
jgi:hypothetical protein